MKRRRIYPRSPQISNQREAALIEKNLIDAQRARFKLAVETGEFLPRLDVCNQVETAHSTVRRELSKVLLHQIPPILEGLTASEMKRPLRRVIDELSDQLVEKLMGYAGETANGNSG